MKHTVSTWTAATLLALGLGSAAIAQPAGYSGPSSAAKSTAPASYSGPSNVPLMTVKQLLDTGRDDQAARLQGRIVSFDGNERYTFKDDTGTITVEIDDEDFPPGPPISAEQRVELVGEFDKGLRKTEFEVDRVIRLP